MHKRFVKMAIVFILANWATAQAQNPMETDSNLPAIEKQVGKLWEAFKNKDKTTLSSLIDDRFRMFEEGLSDFADKKAEVNAVDDYTLLKYALSDFTVKTLGPDSALITYTALYEGKSGSETLKAKSIFSEVWVRTGSTWKDFYLQETYVK